MAEQLKSFVAE
jgi:hypothetical protein